MEQKTRLKIAVLGFGREGKSLLRFLRNRGINPRQSGPGEIWILDKNPRLKVPRGARAQLGENYLKNLNKFDLIFRSPGIPYNLPHLKKARRGGVIFSNATKLFFENCPAKIIGVTGTKGKGTTSTLIYRILRAARKSVFLAGNIGKPALDLLPKLKKNSLVVFELSSFQLQDLNKSPQVAVTLDIFPDHQDAHLNLKEYYEAKTNIARHQKRGDMIFYFKNSGLSRWTASKSRGRKIAVDENRFGLFRPADLKIPGRHNFKNAAMAATVALRLGVPRKAAIEAAKNFRGMEHRLELVRTMRTPRGLTRKSTRTDAEKIPASSKNQRGHAIIKFYNDSASTNPHTAAAAIKSFPGEAKILIAGGQDKGLDYKTLASALKNSDTELAVLFGENRRKIKRRLIAGDLKTEIRLCKNLRGALHLARSHAKHFIAACRLPVTVLFSPGAASFDQFKDYADRGRQFKKLVRKI